MSRHVSSLEKSIRTTTLAGGGRRLCAGAAILAQFRRRLRAEHLDLSEIVAKATKAGLVSRQLSIRA